MPGTPPKVSVCVVSYNQAKYIGQCLQSLVDQKTDFEFEVIVADDCSRDGTQKIIKDFAARYPHHIRAVLNEKNVGAWPNYKNAHGLARGEYIAHLDGDDYALPGKLQAQADYLDAHPSCNLVWHRVYVSYEDKGTLVEDLIDPDALPGNGFTRADLLRYMTIGVNSSKMYRANLLLDGEDSKPVFDFIANVEQIGSGNAAFAGTRPLGVYRAGIGVARNSFTKTLQKDSLLYFFAKYPEHAVQISTAAIGRLVIETKNRNWREVAMFASLVAKVFRFRSIPDILAHWKFLMMFRLP